MVYRNYETGDNKHGKKVRQKRRGSEGDTKNKKTHKRLPTFSLSRLLFVSPSLLSHSLPRSRVGHLSLSLSLSRSLALRLSSLRILSQGLVWVIFLSLARSSSFLLSVPPSLRPSFFRILSQGLAWVVAISLFTDRWFGVVVLRPDCNRFRATLNRARWAETVRQIIGKDASSSL